MSAEVVAIRKVIDRLIASFPRHHAKGKSRILITAGPTYEDIDAVRFIGNRSTGLMGITLAEEAYRDGLQPVLILGPTHLEPSNAYPTIRIRSTLDLQAAVNQLFPYCDALIMAAAPADYRPESHYDGKLHKKNGGIELKLVRNPDILAELKGEKSHQIIIGFSLDTTVDLEQARKKQEAKGMDIIVANSDNSFAGKGTDARILETGQKPIQAGNTKQALAIFLISRVKALIALSDGL